ncbi:DEKNAAC100261 [Brettanomyces naardenensis]|uniref:DEKNAAC100261 n=1 Tax=Brettanomyces naardenensis TaxID=13370 RepID=A0A448YGG2_BRENA|nr:DEKNAAC100261 [Brettanomyces naardenensis]
MSTPQSEARSDSDSGSGSESRSEDEKFESIIAQRERRPNAGSRMRQLLALEEAGDAQLEAEGEEEDVDLLFQEDENDAEFVEEEEEEEGEEEDDTRRRKRKRESDQDEGDEAEEEGEEEEEEEEDGSEGEEGGHSDENFSSDSDTSSYDSEADDSEGERELEMQEKIKKRKLRKKEKIIPHLKPISTSPKKAKKTNSMKNPLGSFPSRRKYLARKSTVEKTNAMRKKLEREEEEKKHFKPRPKEEYVEKTLEERLAEAMITEKQNTLSLNQYFEKEMERKRKQRELANSRKLKLTEYLRFYSAGVFITPNEEVQDLEKERQRQEELLLAKNRRRRGGKKKKLKIEEADTAEKGLPGKEADEPKPKTEAEANEKTVNNDGNSFDGIIKGSGVDGVAEDNITAVKIDDEAPVIDGAEGSQQSANLKVEGVKKETVLSGGSTINEGQNGEGSKEIHDVSTVDKLKKEVKKPEEAVKLGGQGDIEKPMESRRADELTESTEDSGNIGEKEGADTLESEEFEEPQIDEKVIYEGPPQLVAVNYISFEKFTRDPTERQMKTFLFGKQANLAATRRDPHSETICIIKQDDATNLGLQRMKADREASYQSLLKFPRFGQTYKIVEESKTETPKEEVKIDMSTPAPVGIYLPNGHKKRCLINGEPASYYDPGNGIPYNSVECFKVLQRVSDSEYYWAQIDKGGVNSAFRGGIGCYLGDNNGRNAKGVPEGF